MINTKPNNNIAPQVIENITRWHEDRNLIDGTTDWNQTKKLLEEFIEVVAAQMPEKEAVSIAAKVQDMVSDLYDSGRIKPVKAEHAQAALKDGLGDMGVVAINMAERNGWGYAHCLNTSYQEIKDRRGKMIDGMYVKEEDL
ncbi:MazG-like pyrophosphatase [Vibrio phage vB_VspP_pVa5]|uniref:Phage DNA binding protein n=1 Tax=Vibrio phage vB_VspP_pVa5 TaxID=1913109 RepID=A0A1J0GV54_9CAUD|nr:MazG-like pyrophosphatase [Vibrio phage vB_VspP_pVa5]APC46061.1 phage DNA binding protein [Vibrio phage vB_VspP_pVa5]